ncbi:unnamed protein product [Aphanomyces euteiches]
MVSVGDLTGSFEPVACYELSNYEVVRPTGKYETSGRLVGGKISGVVGGAAGDAAGGALGTAVAVSVGTAFGKSVGSSLGGAAAGQRAGTWMDGKIGRQVDKYKARNGTGKRRV